MSLIRKHVAVLQAWACLALVFRATNLLFYRLSQQKVTVIKIVWGGMKAPSVGFRVEISRPRGQLLWGRGQMQRGRAQILRGRGRIIWPRGHTGLEALASLLYTWVISSRCVTATLIYLFTYFCFCGQPITQVSRDGPGVGRSVPKMNQWDEGMSRLSAVHGRGPWQTDIQIDRISVA